MTREQALTMIVASIAMEESALSRVIDAEGEKLRCILDRCQEAGCCEETPKEILEANDSITRLLDAVTQNQEILRGKLALALNAGGECPPEPPCPPPCAPEPPCPPSCSPEPPCPPPCPPEPPCPPPCPSEPPCPPSCSPEPPCPPSCPPEPPCPPPVPCREKSLVQLRLPGDGFLWKAGCPIPWEYQGGQGNAAHWFIEAPYQVELDPGRAWFVSCTFLVRDFQPKLGFGCIRPECTGALREPPPLCFDLRCACGEAVTLPYSTLLLPGGVRAVAFRLCSRSPVWVEQAQLNIIEL